MSKLTWTRSDWHEVAYSRDDDYSSPRLSALHPYPESPEHQANEQPGFQVNISHKYATSVDQAKRLAEFIRADAIALDVKINNWLADDNAAPVKSHPIPLASRGADEPIDLASDLGRMLGMGGKDA